MPRFPKKGNPREKAGQELRIISISS